MPTLFCNDLIHFLSLASSFRFLSFQNHFTYLIQMKFGLISPIIRSIFGIFVNTSGNWQDRPLLYGLIFLHLAKLRLSHSTVTGLKSQLKIGKILFNSSKELTKGGDNETASMFWSNFVIGANGSNSSSISKFGNMNSTNICYF